MNYQRERSLLKRIIRSYFDNKDFLEVETPIAVISPGTEQYLRYFKTEWVNYHGEGHSAWLRSSPELHMKQLLADGHDRIYQIATCYRNHGELSDWHHPEFQMLEWYEKDLSFDDFISQTEDFLKETKREFDTKSKQSNLALPKLFSKFSVHELFEHFSIELVDRDPDLPMKAKQASVQSITDNDDFHSAYFKVFLEKIEPLLARENACIVYDYPASQAALAAIEGNVAKRVEFYVKGVELSNGFKECLSWNENLTRYRETMHLRKNDRIETPEEDPNFFEALRRGIPPCCGNALGFDRWLALLLGLESIAKIIPFRNKNIYRL